MAAHEQPAESTSIAHAGTFNPTAAKQAPGRAGSDDSAMLGGSLLTAEEELRYQRALWINRLLKEQLAAQTQGLSIQEIEEAQAQIQANVRATHRLEAWPSGSTFAGSTMLSHRKSARAPASPKPSSKTRAPSALNRHRQNERIKQENSVILRRLENVRSCFTPRTVNCNRVQRISPRSRLIVGSSQGMEQAG